MRIAKAISDAGICSRRAAEKLILEQKVKLNGALVLSPALNVSAEDVIEVEGRIIPNKPLLRIWLYHKPPGLITTYYDPEGRSTIFDNLPATMPKVISVGRLDIQSEGLLILTNSGEFSREMELPSSRITRKYTVHTFGCFDLTQIKKAENGITIDHEFFSPTSINLVKSSGMNSVFEVMLMEGKNREIRKIFEYFGLRIKKLIRTEYGKYQLGNLKPGQVIEVQE
jgi:23S rRNA pseudouridine2605 synthase